MAEYKAESIKVLEGLEAVRKRPAMYIGSTGKEGIHHLVWETVDNAVDEALAEHCTIINVTINKDGSLTVQDDGRSYIQEYSRGVPKYPVKKIGTCPANEHGTTITFWPDEEIFSTLKFDYQILENRFREVAFLNAGLRIILLDEEKNKKEEFYAEGGLAEFVKWLNRSREALHKPVYFKRQQGDTIVEIALQYNDSYQENIFGFVNTINTVEGGTHVVGFKTALTRVINDYAQKNNMLKNESLQGEDVREGITAIISLKIPEPQFEGQTKTKLGNSELKGVVDSIVT